KAQDAVAAERDEDRREVGLIERLSQVHAAHGRPKNLPSRLDRHHASLTIPHGLERRAPATFPRDGVGLRLVGARVDHDVSALGGELQHRRSADVSASYVAGRGTRRGAARRWSVLVLAILGSGPASGPAVALMNTSGETRGFGSRVEVPG